MGDYIYKTGPALVRQATIKLDTGEMLHTTVAGYKFAYKLYNWGIGNCKDPNLRFHSRFVAPAVRAFAKRSMDVPNWGAAIEDKGRVEVGDRVFKTTRSVSMVDYYFDRVGTVINLDDSERDDRTLAQRINPGHYGFGRASVLQYVGMIILHDYGFRGQPATEDPAEYIAQWKAKLDPDDLNIFERLERPKF